MVEREQFLSALQKLIDEGIARNLINDGIAHPNDARQTRKNNPQSNINNLIHFS